MWRSAEHLLISTDFKNYKIIFKKISIWSDRNLQKFQFLKIWKKSTRPMTSSIFWGFVYISQLNISSYPLLWKTFLKRILSSNKLRFVQTRICKFRFFLKICRKSTRPITISIFWGFVYINQLNTPSYPLVWKTISDKKLIFK